MPSFVCTKCSQPIGESDEVRYGRQGETLHDRCYRQLADLAGGTPVLVRDIEMPFGSIGGVHGEMGHRIDTGIPDPSDSWLVLRNVLAGSPRLVYGGSPSTTSREPRDRSSCCRRWVRLLVRRCKAPASFRSRSGPSRAGSVSRRTDGDARLADPLLDRRHADDPRPRPHRGRLGGPRPHLAPHTARRWDLEGIVAKRKADSYRPETVWYKIKSRTYTQGEGRWELFQKK